jgi:hypothetical protein
MSQSVRRDLGMMTIRYRIGRDAHGRRSRPTLLDRRTIVRVGDGDSAERDLRTARRSISTAATTNPAEAISRRKALSVSRLPGQTTIPALQHPRTTSHDNAPP